MVEDSKVYRDEQRRSWQSRTSTRRRREHARDSQDPGWNAAQAQSSSDNWRSWTHGDLFDAQKKLEAAEKALSNEQRRHETLQEKVECLEDSLRGAEQAFELERSRHQNLKEQQSHMQEQLTAVEQAWSNQRRIFEEEKSLLHERLTAAEAALSQERSQQKALEAKSRLAQAWAKMSEARMKHTQQVEPRTKV